jgi:hypothetical protein
MRLAAGLKAQVLALSLILLGRSAASSAAATCTAIVSLSNAWEATETTSTYFSVNINLINTGTQILTVPWTLMLVNSGYGNIRQVCRQWIKTSLNCQRVSIEQLSGNL